MIGNYNFHMKSIIVIYRIFQISNSTKVGILFNNKIYPIPLSLLNSSNYTSDSNFFLFCSKSLYKSQTIVTIKDEYSSALSLYYPWFCGYNVYFYKYLDLFIFG